MAAVFGNSLSTNQGGASGSLTITTSNTVTSGGLIVVGVGTWTTGAATTHNLPTVAGVTFVAGHTLPSGQVRSSIYYGIASAGLASSSSISCTWGANSDAIVGAAYFTGVDATRLAFNGAAATNTAWSTGAMAGGAGHLAVSVCFEDGSGTATSSGSPNEAYETLAAGQGEAEVMAYNLSSAASETLTGNWTVSVGHVAVGMVLEATAEAGVASNRMRRWQY